MKLPTLLVVDDNEVNRMICQEIFGQEYRVVPACDGEEALVQFDRCRPDLVLLDVMMPGIDGLEVCRRLRISRDPHVKILMVSAQAHAVDRVAGYEAGADDYVTKPFDEAELLSKVRVHLRLRHVEEVDEIKQRMLSVLHHGNHQPIEQIITLAQQLTRTTASAAGGREGRTREVAAQIVAGASQLRAWLTAGEQLVALKDGNVLFEPQWTDLADAMRQTADCLRPSAATAGSILAIDCHGPLRTQCDLEFVLLLMQRMVGEAIAGADCGSTIRFRGERTPTDQIRLSVAWDCPAMTTAEMASMFEPFGNPEEILRGGRDGLGLAIAHQIALVHGGLMRAKNIDGGVEVQAELPAAPEGIDEPFDAGDLGPQAYDDGYGDDGAYTG